MPDEDVSASNLTFGSGSSRWDRLNDGIISGTPDDTNGVEAMFADDWQRSGFTNPSFAGTCLEIKVNVRTKNANSEQFDIKLYSDGSSLDGSSGLIGATTSYANYSHTFSVQKTAAQLTNLEVRFSSFASVEDHKLSEMEVEIVLPSSSSSSSCSSSFSSCSSSFSSSSFSSSSSSFSSCSSSSCSSSSCSSSSSSQGASILALDPNEDVQKQWTNFLGGFDESWEALATFDLGYPQWTNQQIRASSAATDIIGFENPSYIGSCSGVRIIWDAANNVATTDVGISLYDGAVLIGAEKISTLDENWENYFSDTWILQKTAAELSDLRVHIRWISGELARVVMMRAEILFASQSSSSSSSSFSSCSSSFSSSSSCSSSFSSSSSSFSSSSSCSSSSSSAAVTQWVSIFGESPFWFPNVGLSQNPDRWYWDGDEWFQTPLSTTTVQGRLSAGGFRSGFRPIKMRITFSGSADIDTLEIQQTSGSGVMESYSNVTSGQVLLISSHAWPDDMRRLNFERTDTANTLKISNIEFQEDSSSSSSSSSSSCSSTDSFSSSSSSSSSSDTADITLAPNGTVSNDWDIVNAASAHAAMVWNDDEATRRNSQLTTSTQNDAVLLDFENPSYGGSSVSVDVVIEAVTEEGAEDQNTVVRLYDGASLLGGTTHQISDSPVATYSVNVATVKTAAEFSDLRVEIEKFEFNKVHLFAVYVTINLT